MRTGPSAGIVFRLVGYLAVFLFRDDMTPAVRLSVSIARLVNQLKSFQWRCANETRAIAIRSLGGVSLSSSPVIASNPSIVGEISGVEVCVQFLPCDAAVFTGNCDCKIDNRSNAWVLLGFRAA